MKTLEKSLSEIPREIRNSIRFAGNDKCNFALIFNDLLFTGTSFKESFSKLLEYCKILNY